MFHGAEISFTISYFQVLMVIISYDISDTKLRTKFSKMLVKHGAIRLQFSVYEVENTIRVIDNIIVTITTVPLKWTNRSLN